MQHKFGVEMPNGVKKELTSTYLAYGLPNGRDTIMAKTVGLTAAIGAQLILNGSMQRTGVLVPNTSDIYLPTLALLENEGVIFEETSVTL